MSWEEVAFLLAGEEGGGGWTRQSGVAWGEGPGLECLLSGCLASVWLLSAGVGVEVGEERTHRGWRLACGHGKGRPWVVLQGRPTTNRPTRPSYWEFPGFPNTPCPQLPSYH